MTKTYRLPSLAPTALLAACGPEAGRADKLQNPPVDAAQDEVGGLGGTAAGPVGATTDEGDHAKAGAELKPIAESLSLALPTALDDRRRGLIDNLRSATDQDFDRVYLQQQEAAHDETNALLSTYVSSGGQADLKAWAEKTLPVIHAHQAVVDALDERNADVPH